MTFRSALRLLLFLVLCLGSAVGFAQFTARWQDHLPYQRAKAVVRMGDLVYCASEEAIFTFSASAGEIERLNKLNGLSDYGIAAVGWNVAQRKLVIGYRNGNLDVVQDGEVTNIPDFKNSGLYPGNKGINHIHVVDNDAYLSTDFGIVRVDISANLIRETYIIGPGGTEVKVYETVVDKSANKIYAATETGIFRANLSNPLIFFASWERMPGLPNKPYNHIAVYFGKVVANSLSLNSPNDTLLVDDGTGGWAYLPNQPQNRKYFLEVINGWLVVVSAFNAIVYDNLLFARWNVSNALWNPYLPQAAWPDSDGNRFWVADYFNGLAQVNVQYGFSFHRPDGPFSSNVYKLTADQGVLWVGPGSLDANWDAQFNAEGLFRYQNFTWDHFSFDEVGQCYDLVAVAINPTNPKDVWAASMGKGIVHLVDGQLEQVYTSANTGGALEALQGGTEIRPGDMAFDSNGDLWITTSLVNKPLAVRRANGSWESFALGVFGGPSAKFKQVLVNRDGHKWMQTKANGIVVVNTSSGLSIKRLSSTEGAGGLPSNNVLAMAEDLDGEIWVGTDEGLGVVYAPENVFEVNRNYDAQPILILTDEGIYERFLAGQTITTIAVDGANKKWIGTASSGVFYVSDDGTETIYQFNTANSPLPSNNILSIAVDGLTGVVYIGTDRGILSFKGNATEGSDQFGEVYAYPNPVRPGYSGPIFIRGLATNAQVKITDVAGNIVSEMRAEGGQALWDGTRFNGERAASGVYLVYLTNDDGSATAVTKILLVN